MIAGLLPAPLCVMDDLVLLFPNRVLKKSPVAPLACNRLIAESKAAGIEVEAVQGRSTEVSGATRSGIVNRR